MRRWIKYILIIFAGTFVVGLLLIAIVLLTFDNDDYRQLAMRSVSYFTDYTLTIDGPFKLELSANPCLTAEEIKLKTKDDRPPPISSIEKFSAKIDLRQLISWNLVVKELQAEDVVMTVKINDPVESARGLDDSPILSGDIDLPVFESVRLRNIQMAVIDATANRSVDIRLHRFDLDDVRNAGPMFLTGEGTIGGQEFSIDGRMGALVAMFKGEKPYPVDFEINLAGISLSVTGTFEDFMEAEGMNLQISGEVAELADLFGLLQIESPPLGRLKFEAAVSHDLNTPRVPYFSVALSGVEQIQFSANGTVANALTGKGANIDFSGSCAIDKILRTIKLESLSGLNLVRVSGRLWETDGILAAENLKGEAVSDQGVVVSSAGRIELGGHVAALRVKSLDLKLKAFYPTSEVLKPLVFERLPEVGPVVSMARLTGSPASLSLENLTIDAGGNGALKFTARGVLTGKMGRDGLTLTGFDLKTTTKSRTTALLADAYGAQLPELGAVSATYRMSGNLKRFRLEQIDLRTETTQGLKTAFTGDIHFDRKNTNKLVGKLDIQMAITAPTVGAATAPWDTSYFPELKNVRATARLSGTTEVVTLKAIELRVGDKTQVQISLSGELEQIFLSQNRPLAGVRLVAKIEADSTAGLSNTLGIRLPDLGALLMEARIRDRQGGVDVETFKIIAGTAENPLLAARGQILQLNDPERTSLKASFETDSLPWVETYLGQMDGENTSLSGELQVKRTAKDIRIEAFRLGTEDGKRLKMLVNGIIQDLSNSPLVDLQLDTSTSAPPFVGSVTGVPIPHLAPVAISGRIVGKIPNMVFDGETHVGETVFSTNIGMVVTAGRPRISGKIAARTVDLRELGIYPEEPPQESSAVTSQGAIQKRLFGDKPLLPFEAFKAVDLSVTLDAEKLIDRDISIRNLDVDIILENGRLTIDPFYMIYSAGFADFDVVIDASGSVPYYEVKIAGEDIDIDDMLARAHKPVIMSGNVSLVVDLISSGRSAHEIAANLNGIFSFALENGPIWRIINLLSKDPLDILLMPTDQRKYTEVHCLINKIIFKKGIGTIEILQMDTPDIRARAGGHINLKEETLELVINPQRKKRFLQRRSAVYLKGSILDPTVTTMPLSEAAELSAAIVLPFVYLPARVLGYLWSLISNDKDATPCFLEGG